MKFFSFKCLISLVFLTLVKSIEFNEFSLESTISKLHDKINSYQTLKSVNFTPPFTWAETVGLYKSEIRINFAGNPLFKELRNGPITSVFDNDMFSTGWIITALLESNLYGKNAPELDRERLKLTLESIGKFNNKNAEKPSSSIIRTFWPQIFNQTTGQWFQQPINIQNVVTITQKYILDRIPFKTIEKILKFFKLEFLISMIERARNSPNTILKAFNIPPDFDDTYLNLGLGVALKRLNERYPKAYECWSRNNTDVLELIEMTRKYAYRPFDEDLNKNVIDPRTFFYAKKFIQEAHVNGEPLSLISTWVQNLDDQRKLVEDKIQMPFNVNNVDVTVAANVIYGITAASISNLKNFGESFKKSEDLQQIYLNSTRFVTWVINSNFSSRPDLAQVYYPSKYNFLWYTSRTLFLLENEFEFYDQSIRSNRPDNQDYLRHFRSIESIFIKAKSYLTEAFENTVTEFLYENQIKSDLEDEFYFCDFIGRDDRNAFGRREPSNDDCLFATSQAINIMIATWTVHHKNTSKLVWKANVPQAVRVLMDHNVNWLKRYILRSDYKAMNAFFSGSVKGFSTVPFWFPANFFQFLNGTYVNPDDINVTDMQVDDLIIGVKGSIREEIYEKLLSEKHFGQSTPMDFHGYNGGTEIFPFWSSQPYTYSVALLALSQYNNLEDLFKLK